MDDKLYLDSKQITNWFNAVRNAGGGGRVLDAFWSGQIDSKCWLVNKLNTYVENASNVYIFGGWIGVLASMLLHCSKFKVHTITNVDIDPWCSDISRDVCRGASNFYPVTGDMAEYSYDFNRYPDIVINTSTEHVDQGTYDRWYDQIPPGSLIVIQGNNFFSCGEHIRCSSSLADFNRMNYVVKPLYSGEMQTDMYTRYMAIFYK